MLKCSNAKDLLKKKKSKTKLKIQKENFTQKEFNYPIPHKRYLFFPFFIFILW